MPVKFVGAMTKTKDGKISTQTKEEFEKAHNKKK